MAGRHYQIHEWVGFEIDGWAEGEAQESRELYGADLDASDITEEVEYTKGLNDAQERFTKNAVRVVKKWVREHPLQAVDLVKSDDYESDDDIAWNTWAHFVGHGVGFWEHMEREHYDSLSRAIDSDEHLGKARSVLEDKIISTVGVAARKAARAKNPDITIERKGYVTKRGTYVRPTRFKIEDKGRPGVRSFGAKSATGKYAHRRTMRPLITGETTLGGPGYTKKSERVRHRILNECVTKFGYRSCLGKLQAILISTAIKPATRRTLEADKKWLMAKYGGPGSFGPRKGRKKRVGGSSKRKNPSMREIMSKAMK